MQEETLPAQLFIALFPAATAMSTLSLHDALPIYLAPQLRRNGVRPETAVGADQRHTPDPAGGIDRHLRPRGLNAGADRKSTRLNSSHSQISYAVFCLKKKKTAATRARRPDIPDAGGDAPRAALYCAVPGGHRHVHPFPTRRSSDLPRPAAPPERRAARDGGRRRPAPHARSSRGHRPAPPSARPQRGRRSEEHTSELQSQSNIVCRLLLEKKKDCCNPRTTA